MRTLYRIILVSIFVFCVVSALWWRDRYLICLWNNFKDRRVRERMKIVNKLLQTQSPYDHESNQNLAAKSQELYSWFRCRREFYWSIRGDEYKGDKEFFGVFTIQCIQVGIFNFIAFPWFILPARLVWFYNPVNQRIINFQNRLERWIWETIV